MLPALAGHPTARLSWLAGLFVCVSVMGAAPVGGAAAAAGLGISVQAEKANIAAEDPHVHWAQPTKAGLLTAYTGTGDQGRAHYDLLGMGGALYEVEGTISASNEAQGVKLGEIQDALALPFAGRPELNWYESQVKRIQSGTFPRTTKVFGRARVGLDFSAEGTVLVLRETVQPAD